MQRRAFSRSFAGVGVALVAPAGALAPLAAQAQGAPKEGSDFHRLQQPVSTDAPTGQIEVVEFFSYACPHCFNFEPALKTWLKQKPAYVAFKRVPVFAEPLQRSFYALEALGQLEAAHDKLFALYHTEKIRPATNKPEAVADWAAKAGVDRTKFLEAFQSFSVAGKVKRANQLADAYQIEGTPAVGIAGRYLVPGQADRTLGIVNALIAEARKG